MSQLSQERKDAELAKRDALYAEAKKQTLETLPAFLEKLASSDHDYSSIVYGVSAAALGAAYAMDSSPRGGITGFQASIVMWQFAQTWMNLKGHLKLIQYDDLLFPQYAHKFTSIEADTWADVQEKALKNLKEKSDAVHPHVLAHWMSIAAGVVPFGLSVNFPTPRGTA